LLKDTVVLKKIYENFGYPGIQAWASILRNEDVLPALRSQQYLDAKTWIVAEGLAPKSDEKEST
jgi:hypothetical protein